MVDASGESSLHSISIINVPVTIITNEELKVFVTITDACVSQTNWIDDSFSSPGGGEGDELDGNEEDFNDMFNLNVNHLVKKALSQGVENIVDTNTKESKFAALGVTTV